MVFKCGSTWDYVLPLASDNVESDELLFYNIVNFDNFFKAWLTIQVAITLEGWTLMMYNYMDCNSPIVSVVFFTVLVIFGAFFALNLVLAQIMESFYANRREEDAKAAS